nr:phospholipase-like protein [Tanacetum cinerariifolium]
MQKNLALIAKYFKKIYKPTNKNLKTSSNSKNKNVDTTPQFKNDNQSAQFGNQMTINVVAVRENVGSKVVQQYGIQCFNCKEYRHFAKECRKPKRVKDSAYHKEKMLLCKQAVQGVSLQVEQYDWLTKTDEEVDEQELEAHYSYMAKIQEVPTADSGTDSKPVEQVQNDAEYNVFANGLQHSEKSKSVSNTCLVETDDSNVIPDSPDSKAIKESKHNTCSRTERVQSYSRENYEDGNLARANIKQALGRTASVPEVVMALFRDKNKMEMHCTFPWVDDSHLVQIEFWEKLVGMSHTRLSIDRQHLDIWIEYLWQFRDPNADGAIASPYLSDMLSRFEYPLYYADGVKYGVPWFANNVQKVYFAINEKDSHWVLEELHIISGLITIYDSLGGHSNGIETRHFLLQLREKLMFQILLYLDNAEVFEKKNIVKENYSITFPYVDGVPL